jgi:hypothetical protein
MCFNLELSKLDEVEKKEGDVGGGQKGTYSRRESSGYKVRVIE